MDPNNDGTAGQAPAKVVINGTEYDVTEAQTLIDTGRKTKEYEQKWNTPLDKVWPAYGESQTKIKTLGDELTAAKKQLEEFQVKKDAGTETQVDVEKAKEAARKLGLVLTDDLDKSGYVKKDDLDKYLDDRDSNRKAVESILATADKLEKEIDGSDGRPKFHKKAVLAYANTYGFTDLTKAYEDMHADTLKVWQEQQVDKNKPKGLKTLQGSGGGKNPKPIKIDDNNVGDALKEALWRDKD